MSLYRIAVNLFVSLFIKKANRAEVKYWLLGLPTRLSVKRSAKSVGKGLCCGENPVRVNKNTTIGCDCHFNGLSVYGGGELSFGNHIHAGADTVIITDNHNYDTGEMIPYDNTTIKKETIIGDFVWLGVRCTILPGARIGEGAIIQAGAVVHGEIPPYAIAGGNPAKVFKYRNIEHFKKLKAEGKYIGGNIE